MIKTQCLNLLLKEFGAGGGCSGGGSWVSHRLHLHPGPTFTETLLSYFHFNQRNMFLQSQLGNSSSLWEFVEV